MEFFELCGEIIILILMSVDTRPIYKTFMSGRPQKRKNSIKKIGTLK